MPEVSLMPVAKQQFFDSNGDPLAAGNIYFYEPGTTTDKSVYSDSTGTVELSNPVTLDSAGMASIWLDGYYKTVVKASNGTTIYTTDNISSQFYQSTNTVQFVDQDDTFTYISGTQFSLTGNATSTYSVGRRVKATVTAGTVYGTISASSAGGSPVITTVTIVTDSGSLDSGLSAIAIGILTSSNPSIPITPLATKTANYTLLGTDHNKKIVLSANASELIIPAANTFPDGFEFELLNIGSNQTTANGTINGFANVTFLQYESAQVIGDGTSWYSLNMHNQEMVGAVKSWHKSLTGVPQTLPWGWVECTGQALSDAESPLNGQTMPDLNNNGRFIRGSNTSGNTQANQNLSHTHTGNLTSNAIAGSGSDDVNVHRTTANFGDYENLMIYDLDGTSGSYAYPAAGNKGILMGVTPTSDNLMANSSNIASLLNVNNSALSVDAAGNAEARPDNISMVYIIKVK